MGNSSTLFWSSALALLLCLGSGCGYRVAAKNRAVGSHKTVLVSALENRTTTFEVEQLLTKALIRSFIEKSSYKVVDDPGTADVVLKGEVLGVNATPVIFGRETFGSTFLVTLNASIELQEQSTGKVLFKNGSYVFREQYEINVDPRNFFSELNPALERIATDFASSVVTTILEGF